MRFAFFLISIPVSIGFIVPRQQVPFSRKTELFETENQSADALKSLVDFHDGTWSGTAVSFSVTNDVMAGVVARKESEEYKSTVKIGLDLENTDYVLSETIEWGDKMSARKFSLVDASVDVDDVDASYSLDTRDPDFPVDLIGTIQPLQFGIEHCIAVNDNERMRCFVYYGIDKSLARVVVCKEQRVAEPAGVIGESMGVETVKEMPVSSLRTESKFSPWPMNLVELTGGVWLGDAVIRKPPSSSGVETPPEAPRGFGPGTENPKKAKKRKKKFANWAVGLQKVTYQYRWDFEEAIQKIVIAGSPLGEALAIEQSVSLSGTVCKDESFSVMLPKEKRMVYFDWMGGNQAGFILGNVAMQIPRFLTFGEQETRRDFFTEIALFQYEDDGSIDVTDGESQPEVVCSMIGRAYDYDGELKLGQTGFFNFKRIGDIKDEAQPFQ